MINLRRIWTAYLEKKATRKDKRILTDALKQNDEQLDAMTKDIWKKAENDQQQYTEKDRVLFQKIKKRIDEEKAPQKKQRQRRLQIRHWVAAASFIGLLGLAGWLVVSKQNSTPAVVESIVGPGEDKQVVDLPDGSKVWLNAATRLSYQEDFLNDRSLDLTGEAYFEVAKNPDVPFRVNFGNNELLVTGTKFNIQAYYNESEARVHVREGSVAVYNAQDTSRLVANDKLAIHTENGSHAVAQDVFELQNMWINRRLSFQNVPLDEVLRSIERYYDVTIVQEENTNKKREHLTAVYPENIALDDLLKGLNYLQNIKYDFTTKDSITIRF